MPPRRRDSALHRGRRRRPPGGRGSRAARGDHRAVRARRCRFANCFTRALVDVESSPVEDLAPAVRVLDAREVKGLEFDHVVLAEPAAIVD
jgi:hypothetical protein